MGKTIEERADDYAKSQSNWITTYDTSLAKHYIAGATEQKAIDIDKACEWWNKELREVNYWTYEETINAFRKAMKKGN